MGARSLVVLKAHFDSINMGFMNDFVYGNMLRALCSLRVFICHCVLYSFGLILRYIFRFQVGDTKSEVPVPPPSPQANQTKRNHFLDSEIDGFREELADFLFGCNADVHEASDERGGEAESSAFMDAVSDVPEDSENGDGETENPLLMETDSDILDDTDKREGKRENSSLKGTDADILEDGKERGTEAGGSVFMESDSANSVIHEVGNTKGGETEAFVFVETNSDAHEDGKKIEENETESSISMEDDSNVHDDSNKREEEKTEGSVFMETDSATTTSKCHYVSGKDISGFIDEPTTMSFTFRQLYMGPDVFAVSDNAFDNTGIIADNEISEPNSEKDPVAQEEEEDEEDESVQEHRTLSIPSTDFRFRFQSEAFGGSDSSDEDYYLFNENSLASDSESESSSSSGLIWGNSSKIDDSISYQFLAGNNAREGFESEILKVMKEDTAEDVKEKQSLSDRKVSGFRVQGNYAEDEYIELEPRMKDLKSLNAHGFGVMNSAKVEDKDEKDGSDHEEESYRNSLKKNEETRWEEELAESDSDEQDENIIEWEHDDLVEQLKMELRNARQGGLATILEEEEEEEEEAESPKVVEDLKPLKIEEKLEYKDQIDEIEKVYKTYTEKMRKLDILNYQTMHAIGLLQLKDPLKLISTPKSTIPGAKPIISQNLWPRKAPRNTSDPLRKFVHELHRDLESVYVGQVCLSWEILCWQHKKAQELKQYDSEGSRRYNLVAGEFQLFQVLMQRFIENEPFQGPRIQNYVRNRCVIRNLLQVPAIKDDSMKDKNITKEGEEDAIASGRLAEIIRESMGVFWEFVRADKDYGNVILKVSHQIGTDLKDPAISDLLVDIRTQQQKKERKLKDIVRSGNCIVKKFQKHHEDQLNHEQLLAQVGLRLISRVVNMSKLRKEQLRWCNEKLHRIKFLNRKMVQVEPSFLLFPC